MREPRISGGTAFMMVIFAICMDALEALLDFLLIGFLFDIFIDPIVAMIFAMWFGHFGVNLLRKSPLGFIGTIVIKMIPILEIIPAWTFFVIKMIAQDRVNASKEL